jgi:hypothetical protein
MRPSNKLAGLTGSFAVSVLLSTCGGVLTIFIDIPAPRRGELVRQIREGLSGKARVSLLVKAL